MRVDRLASLFVAKPLIASGLMRPAKGIPILMYHSVSDDPEHGTHPYHRLATSPAHFHVQMQWLHQQGYETIGVPEALERLSDGLADHTRAVVLTFDDGFRDFLTDAWPTLSEFGFTATVFLPTGYIGHPRMSFNRRDCLTWSEVRALHTEGARFGAHTVTHPRLHTLPWTDIRRELRDGKARIEEELQTTVDTFAYPYAFPQEDLPFLNQLKMELSEVGYAYSVTTAIGRSTTGCDPLHLKRLPINQADDLSLFASKIFGAYDWVGGLQGVVRRAGSRRHGHRTAERQ